MFRSLVSLCFLILSMSPARACWDAPDHACFTALWSDQALAHAANDPRVAHLYDLINWGTIPPGEGAARRLIEGLSYDDMVAHHALEAETADTPMLDMLAPNGTEQPSVDLALLLMLGYLNAPDQTAVPTDYLLPLYDIARQSGDRGIAASWYARLPPYLRADPGVVGPDGTPKFPDPFAEAQAYTIATLAHLRDGKIDEAQTSADQATGEPAFLAWRAIAQHAIADDDMTAQDDLALLTKAVAGMRASFDTTLTPVFDEEALNLALEAAEAEYAATGDPDALVGVYESSDPSAHDVPIAARLTTALAARYLNVQTGATTEDGFDTALAAIRDALQSGFEEDTATAMRNARTALRLGLETEAAQIIDLAFAHDLGVPPFELYDMPLEPTLWADAWLAQMLARYDGIISDPAPFETREYWSNWVGEDALSEAVEITRLLAFYGYRDEAHDFADRASAYLASLPVAYPDLVPTGHARLFDNETAALLYPPDVALPRMRRGGMGNLEIPYAQADAKRPDIALMVLEAPDGLRNMGHWMELTKEVPDWQRADYIALLRPLIKDEADRLRGDGYPGQEQELYAKAAVFFASVGDWPAARRYFGRLEDVVGTYGPVPASRNRLIALRDIAKGLSNEPPQIVYPYDDFAL